MSSWSTRIRLPHIVGPHLRWLLAIPLIAGLAATKAFSENWTSVQHQNMTEITPIVQALTTSDLQWVTTPFGQEYFVGQAIESGLKLSTGVKVWHWHGRSDPLPVLIAHRDDLPSDSVMVTIAGGIPVYRSTVALPYVSIRFTDGTTASCTAHGRGGDIDVVCDSERAGTLVVQENYFSGWSASVNGVSAKVDKADGQWLALPIEAGRTEIEFRYRPWDVPAGIALMFIGFIFAAIAIWKPGSISLARDPY